MLESAIAYTQDLVASYGVWGVLAATVLEEIVAPIPSALVPLAAGFFLLPSDATFAMVAFQAIFVVALPVAVGISFGSALVYAIAYYGGKPLLEKYGRILGLTWEQVEGIERKMIQGHKDEVTLFLLRMVPVIPGVAVSAFCGAVRYPFKTFLSIAFMASLLRAFIIGLIGWRAGEYYVQYLDSIDKYESKILVIAVILIFGGIFIHLARGYRKRKRKQSAS